MSTQTRAGHDVIIDALREQYELVTNTGPDGVYLWLDDEYKICNERLAAMFGYGIDEWCAAASLLETFIDEEDRPTYAQTYELAVHQLSRPVTFAFTGVRGDGTRFAAETCGFQG